MAGEIKYWVNSVHLEFILSVYDNLFSKICDKYIRQKKKKEKGVINICHNYTPWSQGTP